MQIECDFTYEAAHRLPNVPDGHKCGTMHGHSYHLTVIVARGAFYGDVDPDTGWVIDFADVRAAVAPIIAQLDHHTINDIIENPTVENQLRWMWDELTVADGGSLRARRLKALADEPVQLVELRLSETPRSRGVYRGWEYP